MQMCYYHPSLGTGIILFHCDVWRLRFSLLLPVIGNKHTFKIVQFQESQIGPRSTLLCARCRKKEEVTDTLKSSFYCVNVTRRYLQASVEEIVTFVAFLPPPFPVSGNNYQLYCCWFGAKIPTMWRKDCQFCCSSGGRDVFSPCTFGCALYRYLNSVSVLFSTRVEQLQKLSIHLTKITFDPIKL